MYYLIGIAIIQLFVGGCIADEDNLIVSIDDGLVRGSYKDSYNGRKFIAFEGIPYAKPPIQNLRFEDPQPVEPWPGTLDAKNTYTCIQLPLFQDSNVIGQEDCLYLNVYIPREKIDPNEKLDVIVHIHGGAFMLGSPAMFAGPLKIMDRDVVYVNFNYRVGPFGFLSTGDGRGNYGLKDQTAALKWVQKNIEKFGGNKDSVTISGVSAGSGSVHLHYFSNLSRGLFHKGFAQSGMALNPWAVRLDPSKHAKILASELGCSDDSVKDIQECLKQRSAQQIMAGVRSFYQAPLLPLVPFGPVIERNTPSAFLTKLPYSQLIANEVTDLPLLVSTTADEGTTPANVMYGRIDDINKDWKKWFPLLLEYYEYEQPKRDEISKKVRAFYFKNEALTKDNYRILIKACSDRLFHLGEEKSARLQAKVTKSDVYFLIINYVGKFIPFNITGLDIDLGAGHGMDGKFYYDGPFSGPARLDPEEERMKDTFLDMMVSFAKTGKPVIKNVDFQPVSKNEGEDFKYLFVNGPDDIQMKATKKIGPREFWNSLGLKEDENAI